MNKKSVKFPKKLWIFFSSLKLTIVIFLSLAVTSIIGTVIPQNKEAAAYLSYYGKTLYNLFCLFNIFDMYYSWWFQLLLILLTINVVVCSMDRIGSVWRIVFIKKPKFNLLVFKKASAKKEFFIKKVPDDLCEIFLKFISKRFGYTTVEKNEHGFCIFAEKWRFSRLGVYLVHLSIVFLLIGGLAGSFFGFEGRINILEGETIKSIRLFKSRKIHDLGIKIRCDKFNVSFYESGAPKEYRSKLTIIDGGKSVLTQDILVNKPLRYKGINIFQSSYGSLPPNTFSLNFTSIKSGIKYNREMVIGKEIDLPEQMGKFIVKKYSASYNLMGHNLGAALIGTRTPAKGKQIEIILPLRFSGFDKMRKGDLIISVADWKKQHYTGLQITYDPGIWFIYTGFIMMIIGCFICFFMSHQKLCIELVKKGEINHVTLAGTSNKNKIGMRNKIAIMASRLEKLAAV